jgi:hypothetical protein
MPWIDPGWLDFKNERAQYRDNQRPRSVGGGLVVAQVSDLD